MKKNKKLLSLALGLTMVFYSCFSALFTAAMPIEELFDEDNPTDPTVHLISSSVIEVTLDKSEYEYTGSQITPEVVSVHYESGDFDMDLVYEEDYTCEFGENVDIGTGTVKIVGSNNSEKDNVFWGSVTVEFDIVEAAESSEVIDESSQIEDESSEIDDESSEVIDESSEIDDESSEVIDESSETDDESSESDSSSTVDEPEGEVIWEGNLSLSDWSQDGNLGIANIPNAKEGGKVTIYATPTGDAKVQISGKDANDNWFDMRNTDGHSFYITDNKVEINLNAEQANILANARQLVLKGVNYTATMITYLAPDEPDSSSEESSEIDDESSEVIDESSEVIDESSEIDDESSEVIDESSEIDDESSEVIDESSEIDDESSEVIDESSEVIDESSETDDSSEVEPIEDPEYVSTNLTLSGIIGANNYYTVPDEYITDDYTVEVVFNATGVSEIRVPLDTSKTKIIGDKKTYLFTLPVKSCDMAKRFKARLHVTSGGEEVFVTNPTTITINQYSSSLANTGNTEEKAFANAILTYGYYSQQVFVGTTPAGITPIDLSDVTYSKLRKYASSTEDADGVLVKGTIYGTSLYLDSGTGIRSYVKDLNGVDTDNLYMQYSETGTTKGQPVKVKVKYSADKDAYYGEIADVGANKLSTMYRICFVEGSRQITDAVFYGAYSYIYSTLRGTSATADDKNLARALYKYSVAAETLIPDNPDPDSSSEIIPDSSSEDESSDIDSSSEDESSDIDSSSQEDSSEVIPDSSSNTDSSSEVDEPDEEVLWEGNITLNSWNDDGDVGLSNIPQAEAGGKITVYATANGDAKLQISGKDAGDNWFDMRNTDGHSFYIDGDKFEITLNAEMANTLATARQLVLKGVNYTATKMTYTAPGQDSVNTLVIWEGSANPTGWSSVVLTGANIPTSAAAGDVLTIEATGSSKVQIGAVQPGDVWAQLDSGDGYDAFDISNGKVTVVLSEDNANLLKNATELHVNGDGITVTKLTLTSLNNNNSNNENDEWTLLNSYGPFTQVNTEYPLEFGDVSQYSAVQVVVDIKYAKECKLMSSQDSEIIKTDDYKEGEGQMVYDFKTNNRVGRNDFDLTAMSITFGQERSTDPTSVSVSIYAK